MPDHWTDRLSAYLDDDLAPGDRLSLEAHLMGCEECRETLAELRRVVARARRLEDRPPAADLWSGIAARIGATPPLGLAALSGSEVVPMRNPSEPRRRRRQFTFSLPQLAAAGIALAVLSGGGATLVMRHHAARAPEAPIAMQPPATPAPDGSGSPTIRPAGIGAAQAREVQTYDRAVGDLQQVLEAGRGQLDPKTIAVLERNVATIDSAIADARRALAADPRNAYLNAHLARTMQQKLDLLRRAAALTQTS